jgi:hypothetical protein
MAANSTLMGSLNASSLKAIAKERLVKSFTLGRLRRCVWMLEARLQANLVRAQRQFIASRDAACAPAVAGN